MDLGEIVTRRVLGSWTAHDAIAWAESLLEEGGDSREVAILASLGLEGDPDPFEVEGRFQQCLAEQGASLPEGREAWTTAARHVCGGILDGRIAPREGLDLMAKLASRTGYETPYAIWDELDDDVILAEAGEEPFLTTGLAPDTVEETIRRTAEQFLRLLDVKLPEDFDQLVACPECGTVARPRLERTGLSRLPVFVLRILRRPVIVRAYCARCGHPDPPGMTRFEARERLLEVLQATPGSNGGEPGTG